MMAGRLAVGTNNLGMLRKPRSQRSCRMARKKQHDASSAGGSCAKGWPRSPGGSETDAYLTLFVWA